MSATEGFVNFESSGGAEEIEASSAPARSRAATRRRIVEAATELFALEGLHAVTSARIAKAAGVAAGTFYLHFADKKQLFREIVFAAVARFQESQRRAGEAAGPELRAQVRARIEELVTFAEQNHALLTLVFGRDHEAASLDEDVLDMLLPRTEQILRGGVESGELSGSLRVAVASQALLGMQTRVIVWWLEDPTRATRAEIVETLYQLHPVSLSSADRREAR